jgi:DNA-directed RNA polymerase specialized sigma24 family protein
MENKRSTMKTTDRKIVALLSGKASDRHILTEAANILYRNYIPCVERYLMDRCSIRSSALRDKIIFEAIARATERIKDFTGGSFLSWLTEFSRRIALEMSRKELRTFDIDRLIIDDYKRNDEKKIDSNSEEVLIPKSEDENDLRPLIQDLLTGKYSQCLESLKSPYRELIEMLLEGQPKEVYIEHYRIEPDNFRQRLSRAIKMLREAIELMGPFDSTNK